MYIYLQELDEATFQGYIRDSQVLVVKEFPAWNWNVIFSLLQVSNTVHFISITVQPLYINCDLHVHVATLCILSLYTEKPASSWLDVTDAVFTCTCINYWGEPERAPH